MMRWKSEGRLLALKGCRCAMISYSKHPADHTSDLWLYGRLSTISGLM